MPVLPTYNAPNESLRIGNEASEAWREGGRVIGALGREGAEDIKQGFETVARNIDQFAQTYQTHQDQTDKINGLKTYTQSLLDYKTKVDNINQTMTGDAQHAALTQAFNDYSKGLQNWQDGFSGSSKEVQLWAQDHISNAVLQARNSFVADTAITSANNSVIDIGKIANNLTGSLGKNPNTTDIDHMLSTWDSTIAAAGQSVFTTDPEKNAKIRADLEKHKEQMVQTGIYNAMTNDPAHAQQIADQMIPYYSQKGLLTEEQQRSLRTEAEGAGRLNYYQTRAQQEDAQRQQRTDAGTALKNLTESTFSLGPDGKMSGQRYVPPDYFSKLIEISKMPGSSDAEVKAASQDAQEILNRQKNGVVATTDQPTYQTLFKKAYNGLTDQDVFTAHAEGKLSDHDSTMLHQAVEDSARNPAMAENKKQFDYFIETFGKQFIVKSDMMTPDSLEYQRLQQFQNDKWQQFQVGLQHNIPAHDLLDQNNKNFIGRDITRYQLTQEQRLKAQTESATTGLSPTPPVDAQGNPYQAPARPIAPPRNPGESAADYLKRTGGQ